MNFYHLDDIPDDLKRYFMPAPQIGLEKTPEEYVIKMVTVFREIKRVMRNDATLWLNLGDSYASGRCGRFDAIHNPLIGGKPISSKFKDESKIRITPVGFKSKDLIGIPWRIAFALQSDGWYLRSDIIWCLSGGTWIYVWTQKGPMPMMLRDLARLKPSTIRLWNGKKWTQVIGLSKSKRQSIEIELVLRSGERISCTPTHRFPTKCGLLEASRIQCGDILESVVLPETKFQKDCVIDEDAAWFAGLYVAEGSKAGDTIQIAGHAKESARWERLQIVAKKYGGSITRTLSGNKMDVRLYGKILNAILDELVTGHTSKDKGFAPVVWRYSNVFLSELLRGYLDGDGHLDEKNQRWRLGFCRNYNLERDLRCLCARLGFQLTLNISTVKYNGKRFAAFKGEIRYHSSDHHNAKDRNEVVEIRKARCREVYDVGVADEPHIFALASGVLTHNSKPNPMPESIKDRPTRAHEYLFLLSKSARYYYDAKAIRESFKQSSIKRINQENFFGQTGGEKDYGPGSNRSARKSLENLAKKVPRGWATSPNYEGWDPRYPIQEKQRGHPRAQWDTTGMLDKATKQEQQANGANKRTVWTIATQPTKEAHFATFPWKLVEPCIKAGCPPGGVVLDPFIGSGTTAMVAKKLGRQYIGIELNSAYAAMAERRLAVINPLFDKTVG